MRTRTSWQTPLPLPWSWKGGDTDPVVDHVATTRNSDQLANNPASAMELEGGRH
ncbi:hypothetical protein DPMN_066505 [Dreissena polymorpha]|uniref:Uncharacterized protein n=1 Tax=Dreissena polymorpha TaxID=45954 RepID=A0A9D3YWF8_DREPO|nr:hypothetical protein DPMN_066505 [Dreissena polymorpha]